MYFRNILMIFKDLEMPHIYLKMMRENPIVFGHGPRFRKTGHPGAGA